jgi:hypothetical protein
MVTGASELAFAPEDPLPELLLEQPATVAANVQAANVAAIALRR